MTPVVEMEGTWEQILEHTDELTGRRVRVTVLPSNGRAASIAEGCVIGGAANDSSAGSSDDDPVLAALERYMKIPLSEEEMQILDNFEQFRKDHPIRFRIPTFLSDPE